MKEDVLLTSDTTFKYMLKHEIYKKRILDTIKRYTNIDLSNYNLINNEVNTGTKKIKDKRMDLVFRNNNHIVIVEMEQFYIRSNEIKDYEYLYSIAGGHFAVGKKYSDVKTTLILFANYVPKKLINIDDKLIDFKFMNAKHNIVKQDIESYEIIIPNFRKMNYNDCNEIEKFLWLFSCKTIKEMKQIVDNEEDRKIIHELERLNMDENFLFEYDNEIVQKKLVNSAKDEGFDEGFDEGYLEGRDEGINQERIKNIKSLFENGVSLELIANSIGISIDEVKKIVNLKDKE